MILFQILSELTTWSLIKFGIGTLATLIVVYLINHFTQNYLSKIVANEPKLKTTYASIAGLGMKNLKGVLSDSDKIRFHHIGVHKAIVDLSTIVIPDLIILDGIIGSELGYPVNSGIAIAGTDNGANTAVVVKPSYPSKFLDLKVNEIIAKPRE